MKPDKAGIWEWFEEDGTKRLVSVCDVGVDTPYLRVYWWGGYYTVNEVVNEPIYDCDMKQVRTINRPPEWPDRWGAYVGDRNSVPEEQLYLMPTPEQREEILKTYKLQQL